MDSPPSYLLVDGHSMIFALRELRELHGRAASAAREALIGRLTRYQDASGVRVVVVFDPGRGGRGAPDDAGTVGSAADDIQVIYAPPGKTADDVIERLAAKYAASRSIVVATEDVAERMMAAACGASWIGAEELVRRLDAADRNFGKRLEAYRKRRRDG